MNSTASSGMNNSRFASRRKQEQNSSLGNVLRHYDDNDRIYNITVPRQQFQLGGYQLKDPTLPRGRNGIDVMEKDMREIRGLINEDIRRIEQDRKRQQMYEQRMALETQLAEKSLMLEQTRTQELEEDLQTIETNRPYGPFHDERRELEWKKTQQMRQKAALQKQMSDKAIRDAEEAQHFAAPPADWEDGLKELDTRIHKAIHGDPDEFRRRQQNEGNQPKVIQDSRESNVVRKEDAETPLSMGVAMFADRILLSEKAKKDARANYKAELDAQMRDKAARRQNELANNLIVDRSYHFGALQRTAPPTPTASEQAAVQDQIQFNRVSTTPVAGMNRSNNNNNQNQSTGSRLFGDNYSSARRY